MPTSDKDIEKLQGTAEKLRSQIAETRAAREQTERESVNDITAAQLGGEIDRLQRELAEEKDRAKFANKPVALAAPLGDAQAAMEAAAAVGEPETTEKPAATAGKGK